MLIWKPLSIREHHTEQGYVAIAHEMVVLENIRVLIYDPATGWQGVYATGEVGHTEPGTHGAILGRIGDARILCEYTDPPNFSSLADGEADASPPS